MPEMSKMLPPNHKDILGILKITHKTLIFSQQLYRSVMYGNVLTSLHRLTVLRKMTIIVKF